MCGRPNLSAHGDGYLEVEILKRVIISILIGSSYLLFFSESSSPVFRVRRSEIVEYRLEKYRSMTEYDFSVNASYECHHISRGHTE